jgi:hypothetical protein
LSHPLGEADQMDADSFFAGTSATFVIYESEFHGFWTTFDAE